LECLVDDFLYIAPQDQDPYFYVNNGNNVWFMFFFCVKIFYFHNILIFYLSWITLS
jgi:hypothetical protein